MLSVREVYSPRFGDNMWWDILKMVRTPMPGSEFKTKEAYYRGSREQRMAYHVRMREAAHQNLKILQRRMTGQTGIEGVTDADPVVDEEPINQEIDRLQELFRFHNRQYRRLKTNSTLQNFFTFEEETDRRISVPHTTRTGSKIVHKEISQEEYDKLSNEDKIKYHARLSHKYKKEGNKKLSNFHNTMFNRLNYARNLPTFPTYVEGYSRFGKEYTKEQYLQMSDEDKRKYHRMMEDRAKKSGDNNLSNWHQRMYNRLRRDNKLPIYFSPEHEAEESS